MKKLILFRICSWCHGYLGMKTAKREIPRILEPVLYLGIMLGFYRVDVTNGMCDSCRDKMRESMEQGRKQNDFKVL